MRHAFAGRVALLCSVLASAALITGCGNSGNTNTSGLGAGGVGFGQSQICGNGSIASVGFNGPVTKTQFQIYGQLQPTGGTIGYQWNGTTWQGDQINFDTFIGGNTPTGGFGDTTTARGTIQLSQQTVNSIYSMGFFTGGGGFPGNPGGQPGFPGQPGYQPCVQIQSLIMNLSIGGPDGSPNNVYGPVGLFVNGFNHELVFTAGGGWF